MAHILSKIVTVIAIPIALANQIYNVQPQENLQINPVGGFAYSQPDTQEIIEILKYYAEYYEVDFDLAYNIVKCESSVRQWDSTGEVLRGVVNNQDIGLFQINLKYHEQTALDMGLNLFDLDDNIKYGLNLLKNEGSKHWTASRPCWGK